jgi:hypothetical protein
MKVRVLVQRAIFFARDSGFSVRSLLLLASYLCVIPTEAEDSRSEYSTRLGSETLDFYTR